MKIKKVIMKEIREHLKEERYDVNEEIDMEVAPCMIQLHLLSKEIIQGREEYLNLLKSQEEMNREEIRNSILHERRERGHSVQLQDNVVSNTEETEKSPSLDTSQGRIEFLGLWNSQQEGESANVMQTTSSLEENNIEPQVTRRSSAIWSFVGIRSFSPFSGGLNTGKN